MWTQTYFQWKSSCIIAQLLFLLHSAQQLGTLWNSKLRSPKTYTIFKCVLFFLRCLKYRASCNSLTWCSGHIAQVIIEEAPGQKIELHVFHKSVIWQFGLLDPEHRVVTGMYSNRLCCRWTPWSLTRCVCCKGDCGAAPCWRCENASRRSTLKCHGRQQDVGCLVQAPSCRALKQSDHTVRSKGLGFLSQTLLGKCLLTFRMACNALHTCKVCQKFTDQNVAFTSHLNCWALQWHENLFQATVQAIYLSLKLWSVVNRADTTKLFILLHSTF